MENQEKKKGAELARTQSQQLDKKSAAVAYYETAPNLTSLPRKQQQQQQQMALDRRQNYVERDINYGHHHHHHHVPPGRNGQSY